MNVKATKQINASFGRLAAVLALILAVSVPSAWARGHKPATQAVQVVGKLSFQGSSAADMVLHQVDGKSYLYIRLAGDEGVMVIDVTHPGKPKTASSLKSSSMGSVKGLAIEKDAALASGGTRDAGPATSDNDRLTVWDISQAGAPRVVQEFPGVKKVIEDARGYIYILDRETLWVVRDKPEQPAGEDNMLQGIFG